MRVGKWYMSGFIVAFLFFYTYLVQYVRGEGTGSAQRRILNQPLDFGYHHYDEMTAWLRNFSANNVHLTALYSIGKSVQGESRKSHCREMERNVIYFLCPKISAVFLLRRLAWWSGLLPN